MSKVFSAKRQTVEAEYEFLDGFKTPFIIVSLSGNESKELGIIQKDNTSTIGEFVEKQARYLMQKNDHNLIDRIIEEQKNEGDILYFMQTLVQEISKARTAKGND